MCTITDEQRDRAPPAGRRRFRSVAIFGLRPRDDRRGIINPTAALSWLEGWVPGRIAAEPEDARRDPLFRPRCRRGDHRHRSGSRARRLADRRGLQARAASTPLAAGGNNIVVGDAMARRLGAGLGDTITAVSSEGLTPQFQDRRPVPHRHDRARRRRGLCAPEERPDPQRAAERHQRDPHQADRPERRAAPWRGGSRPSSATNRWPGRRRTKSILEALVIRNVIMYTVVARDHAGGRLRHLQHHLDHHP